MDYRDVGADFYDVAQVCENGHVANAMSETEPQRDQDFCSLCGAKTIRACPSCNTPIRGYHHIPALVDGDYDRPAYCSKCGAPFPWIVAALEAACALADALDGLRPADPDELKRSLAELVKDTPNTRVAEAKVRQIVQRSGTDAVDAMRSALTDVISENVRKNVFGT
jgi:hypothetical protein